MGTLTKVATLAELAPGTARMVEVNGKEVALFNVDGKVYATTNICPHQGGPMAEGMIEGTTVVCPWHAWSFDICTGVSPVNPRAKLEKYSVKVEGQGRSYTIVDERHRAYTDAEERGSEPAGPKGSGKDAGEEKVGAKWGGKVTAR